MRRSPKKTRVLKNKWILGRSIEERPSSVEDCAEFGHWEADLVIGSKSDNDDALLTMIERKIREYWMIRVPGRDPNGVMTALSEIRARYGEHRDDIFKTITTDSQTSRSARLKSGVTAFQEKSSIIVHPTSFLRRNWTESTP